MRKILIINRCITSNLGDQMIGRAMVNLFSPYGKIAQKDLLYNEGSTLINLSKKSNKNSWKNSLRHKLMSKYKRFKQNKRFEILKKNDFDFIIFGGGELISSSFSNYLKEWSLKIKKYQPKAKVVLFSVGVPNDFNEKSKCEIQSLLETTNMIFVRDAGSSDNLQRIFHKSSIEVPDVVFSSSIVNDLVGEYNLLGISDFSRLEKYKSEFSDRTKYYEKCVSDIYSLKTLSSLPVHLFYTTQSDLYECFKFKDYIKSNYGMDIEIASIESLDNLLDVIRRANIVQSPRMHGCIISMLLKKDVKPELISPKMNNFYVKYIESLKSLDLLKQELSIYAKSIFE